jgi:hypothetical protein
MKSSASSAKTILCRKWLKDLLIQINKLLNRPAKHLHLAIFTVKYNCHYEEYILQEG